MTDLKRLANRIAGMIARGDVHLVNDDNGLQLLQVDAHVVGPDEGAEHFQQYGFSSVPLAGAEAVMLLLNGDPSHPIVIAVPDGRYRPTGGEPGEVAVYNHTGAKVKITKDGDIELTPAPGRKVKIGSESAADPPALSSELADLKSAIATWTPVPNDGGNSLKAVFSAWSTPGATKVDVE